MLQRIKKIAGKVFSHIMNNRAAYAWGVSIILHMATAAGFVTYHKKWSDLVVDHQTQSDLVVDLLARLANRDSDENFGGYSQKIIKKDSTGETWNSNKAAAKAAGVSASNMSNHTNGRTDHINGETYSITGLSTSNGI
jgi:hypothetical protein